MQRLLVIQLKRIGDFILTVPALAALRESRPQAEIVLMVPSAVAGLAACLPMVDRVITHHPGRLNLEAWTSTLAGPWDACFDFGGTDRSALLTKLSGAKVRLTYKKFAGLRFRRHAYTHLCPASVRDLHTVDFHLALLREYDPQIAAPPEKAHFRLPPEVVRSAQQKLLAAGLPTGDKPYVILHPGTAREEKFWPDERWAELAQWLVTTYGVSVVLTGSGAGLEAPHLERLRELCTVPLIDLTGKLALEELLALIGGCQFIVGVDSMAMHLASMLRIPQVAIFGPTNPYHWRSRHERSFVLQGGTGEPLDSFKPKTKRHPTNQVSTGAVMRAIERLYPPIPTPLPTIT